MRRRVECFALLLGLLLVEPVTPVAASLLERRLESLPAASWMRPVHPYLVVAAGTPTLAGASSELGLHGEWELQKGLGLHLGVELLQAASYREESLQAGLALSASGGVLRVGWQTTRAGVEGLLTENRSLVRVALAIHSGPFSFGARQSVVLDDAAARIPDRRSWALRMVIDRLALALLREDARWGGEDRWSAGLEFRVSPALLLGLSTDEVQEELRLQLRRGYLALRVSLPVASMIDAGPYLALEWSDGGEGPRP